MVIDLLKKASFPFEYSREAALKLERLGFPKSKDSRWKYTDVLPLIASDRTIIPSLLSANSELKSVESYDFASVEDSFGLLSLALGNTLHLTPSEIMKLERKASGFSMDAVVLEVGEGESLELTENSLAQNALYFPLTLIKIAKNGRLKYKKLESFEESMVVDNTIILMEENSHLEFFTLSTGSKIVRNNLQVSLRKHAHADLRGAYMVKNGHLDNYLKVKHLEGSQSRQLYKGIVEDGKAAFTGCVYIDRNAPNSSARQLNKTLLLSDRAEMNTRPELDILNDEVECSHGATVGNVDEKELFYIMSRGIGYNEAREMLIKGFMKDVLRDELNI